MDSQNRISVRINDGFLKLMLESLINDNEGANESDIIKYSIAFSYSKTEDFKKYIKERIKKNGSK